MGQNKLQCIALIGAGGAARDILDIVDAINLSKPTFEMVGYIVDSQYGEAGTIINDKPILGDLSWLQQNPDVQLLGGVGEPELRRKVIQRAQQYHAKFCTLIHPSVICTKWIEIGHGTIIAAGCILTNQIRIGNHAHLNIDTTVAHDCVIEDYVTISPGVHCSGNVSIGEGSFIGTGANIIEKRNIGSWATVGAGSAIIKDVPNNSTVVGVPGKVIKTKHEGWYLD